MLVAGTADSVVLDPHKWLYAPLEAGCVLVRAGQRLRDAFSYHPPYYHFGEEAVNLVDYGPQNSRGFRALKVWLGEHCSSDCGVPAKPSCPTRSSAGPTYCASAS